jgi:hypothetical protein
MKPRNHPRYRGSPLILPVGCAARDVKIHSAEEDDGRRDDWPGTAIALDGEEGGVLENSFLIVPLP